MFVKDVVSKEDVVYEENNDMKHVDENHGHFNIVPTNVKKI